MSLCPNKLRVLIVRHGETRENVEGIIQGQLDTDLNVRGRLQADVTGRFLSSTRIDRVIASPLKRAADTARTIHKHQNCSPTLKLEFDDRLKERAFGVLEGHVYHGGSSKPEDTEGIERMEPFSERLGSFWNDLVTRTGEVNDDKIETVVLVSHGAAISALMNQVLIPGRYLLVPPSVQPSRFWNCSITELLIPVINTSHPTNTKSPGHLSRKTTWSIRPIHLGVQGSQFLLDHDLQKKFLAMANANSVAETAIKQVETRIRRTESEFERDPKGKEQLKQDTIKAPDGKSVENDIGYGKAIGVVVKWSNVDHLKQIDKSALSSTVNSSASSSNTNVDELV
ncbi:uncharacterized protein MEPE_04225 [Melanopsichium pennsylvanicum]|uniref:Phosphoglycerate mutase n=2 Tax=Melanopsichium pennsylvanicum TaxID=63383 RepID=A0AAJ5C680_9BASI|nr:phosphoglycerate mutase [Melanopsichium pennsylvanicum 4]SNX85516.1 uncharacterized protein MEPE_04225 [Melanopsichium pennsylvanicum]